MAKSYPTGKVGEVIMKAVKGTVPFSYEKQRAKGSPTKGTNTVEKVRFGKIPNK